MSRFTTPVRRAAAALLLAASAVVSVSCGPTEVVTAPEAGYGVIRIHAYNDRYAPGNVIPIVVNNVGPTTLSMGACADGMEQLVGGVWRATTAFALPLDCDLVLYVIVPGEFAAVIIPAPASLPPGTYRARFDGIRVVGPNTATTNLPIGVRYSERFEVSAPA